MNQQAWTFRGTTRRSEWRWRRRLGATAWLVLAGALTGGVPLMAQTVHAVQENGHTVWTNDAPAIMTSHLKQTPKMPTQAKAKMSGLEYWSSLEKRWKPIPASTTPVRHKAEAAADEVATRLTRHAVVRPASAIAPRVVATPHTFGAPEIDRYIEEASARHHVDPNLVRALVKVESNFNPKAVSSKGAMGLMQLMPATARSYDLSDPFDAAQNVDAGVRHLKGLLQNFNGDVPLSLAAYNAGAGAVTRNGGIPPYAETRNYVRRITSLMGGSETLSSPTRRGLSAAPIHMWRDPQGRLVITNLE